MAAETAAGWAAEMVATLTVSSQWEAAKRLGQRRGEGKNRKRAEAQGDGRRERPREEKLQVWVI